MDIMAGPTGLVSRLSFLAAGLPTLALGMETADTSGARDAAATATPAATSGVSAGGWMPAGKATSYKVA